jgi:3-hydroxyacyl-[acyl-carrier-protein] dehydratase
MNKEICNPIEVFGTGLVTSAGRSKRGGKDMTARFRHEYLPLSGKESGVVAAARFPGDSAWFSGHFPGHPIVPGVALIALAAEAVVERECGEGRSVAITGVRRVRFRLPVRPDDEVTLKTARISNPKGPAYAFTVCLAGETVCSGVLTAQIVPSRSDRPAMDGQ